MDLQNTDLYLLAFILVNLNSYFRTEFNRMRIYIVPQNLQIGKIICSQTIMHIATVDIAEFTRTTRKCYLFALELVILLLVPER